MDAAYAPEFLANRKTIFWTFLTKKRSHIAVCSSNLPPPYTHF